MVKLVEAICYSLHTTVSASPFAPKRAYSKRKGGSGSVGIGIALACGAQI